jgi:hypothetical protein
MKTMTPEEDAANALLCDFVDIWANNLGDLAVPVNFACHCALVSEP